MISTRLDVINYLMDGWESVDDSDQPSATLVLCLPGEPSLSSSMNCWENPSPAVGISFIALCIVVFRRVSVPCPFMLFATVQTYTSEMEVPAEVPEASFNLSGLPPDILRSFVRSLMARRDRKAPIDLALADKTFLGVVIAAQYHFVMCKRQTGTDDAAGFATV
jgi:hypothetical protein